MHPLKTFRKNHQPPLSQRDLAKLVGVDRVTVARWESGARKPDGESLAMVAQVTGLSRAKLRPDLVALLKDHRIIDDEPKRAAKRA